MIEAAFLARVRPDPSGCWGWDGAHSKDGYGQLYVRPRMLYAHRVAYRLYVGPLVDGLVIDHLCQNPGCCNPAHLEQIEHRENIRRGRAATKANCKRGHARTPENTYVRKDGSRICAVCTLEKQRQARQGSTQ